MDSSLVFLLSTFDPILSCGVSSVEEFLRWKKYVKNYLRIPIDTYFLSVLLTINLNNYSYHFTNSQEAAF